MPYAIDPHASWLALEQAAKAETNSRRAGLIREVGRHRDVYARWATVPGGGGQSNRQQ